jgi:hypothetical protein
MAEFEQIVLQAINSLTCEIFGNCGTIERTCFKVVRKNAQFGMAAKQICTLVDFAKTIDKDAEEYFVYTASRGVRHFLGCSSSSTAITLQLLTTFQQK